MVNNEKLKLFLEDSDIEKVQASDPEKYKLLLDKVHLISDTKEEIGKLKDELSGNLEDKVDKLLLYIDEAEKEAVIGNAKSMVNKKEEILIEKVDKKIKEKLGFFGGLMDIMGFSGKDIMGYLNDAKNIPDDSKPWNNIGKKFFGFLATGVIGWLGLSKVEFGAHKKSESEGQEEVNTDIVGEEEVKPEKVENPESDELSIENIEERERMAVGGYSLLGRQFLLKVSASNVLIKKKNNYVPFINKVNESGKTYSQIKDIYKKLQGESKNEGIIIEIKQELGLGGLSINGEQLTAMLDTIAGNNAQFVIDSNLKDIDTILDGESFKKKFGKNYHDLKGRPLDDIPFNDLIFLLGYSLPIGVFGLANSFLPKLEDLGDFKETVTEEIENRKVGFFSKKFLTILSTSIGLDSSGISDKYFNDLFNKKIEEESNIEIKSVLRNDLKNFLIFRDSVLINLKLPKYKLPGLENFETDYVDKMSSKDLLSLYLLFDGHPKLSSLDGLNNILFYGWIAELPGDNTTLRDNYIQKLVENSGKSEEEYLSAEEITFLAPLLKHNGYILLVKQAADLAASTTIGSKQLVLEAANSLGINLPKSNSYDYIDYSILAVLVAGSYLTYKLPIPLPLKLVISGAFSFGGASQLFGILKNKGVVEYMLKDNTLPEEVKNILIDLKNKDTGTSDFLESVSGLFAS